MREADIFHPSSLLKFVTVQGVEGGGGEQYKNKPQFYIFKKDFL
jgi:hypothetical protein